MTTIVFEAHGTTYDNEQGLTSGHNDVGLSPLGEEQARSLGSRYVHTPLDAVFCSDLTRAYHTAEIAFEGRNVPIIQDAKLRECNEERFTPEQRAEFDHNGYLVMPKEQPYLRTSVLIDRDIVEERAHINTKGLLLRILCPVLILHGDNDAIVPLTDSQEALTYLSPDSRLEVIKGADHFFMQEREELIARSAQWFADHL